MESDPTLCVPRLRWWRRLWRWYCGLSWDVDARLVSDSRMVLTVNGPDGIGKITVSGEEGMRDLLRDAQQAAFGGQRLLVKVRGGQVATFPADSVYKIVLAVLRVLVESRRLKRREEP